MKITDNKVSTCKIFTTDHMPDGMVAFSDNFRMGSKRTFTDEGYLKIEDCILARVGIQEYFAGELGLTDRKPDAIIKVYRSPEEVFSQESLDSFKLKPVTNNHPDKMVTQETIKKFQVGTIGQDVRRDGDFVKATLIFTDKRAIDDIQNGKEELSNGYLSGYVWGDGVAPTGETFNAKQTNIRGNHTALVEKGRCGGSCSVADSGCSCGGTCAECKTTGGFPMEFEIVQVGDLQIKVAKDHAVLVTKAFNDQNSNLEKLQGEKDELEQKLKDVNSEMEKLEAKKDEAEKKAKEAEDALPNADSLDALVSERITFRDSVAKLDDKYDIAGKDSATVRREIVQAANKDEDLKEKSDDYIEARFDSMLAAKKSGTKDSMDEALKREQANKDGKNKNDDTPISCADARQKFVQKSNTAGHQASSDQ